MAVDFDSRSLSPLVSHTVTEGFTSVWTHSAGQGHNLCAVAAVLLSRKDVEAGDAEVAVTFDGVDMVSQRKVWFDYDDGIDASFLEVFALRGVPKGSSPVVATVSTENEMAVTVRTACLTYQGVGDIGVDMSGAGTEPGTVVSSSVPSALGRRLFHVAAVSQPGPVGGYNQIERQQLDFGSVSTQGVCGDADGGPTVTVSCDRTSGRDYAWITLDLLPAPSPARLVLKTFPPNISGPVKATPPAARLLLRGRQSGTEVTVFAPATVLTLEGLNYNQRDDIQNSLLGQYNSPPYTRMKVDYPASLASDSITIGVSQLDQALRSVTGKRIVLAHDQGAQVCARWMRAHHDDPTAPSAVELMFILTGNPLRQQTGFLVGRPEVDGIIGEATPLDTPWSIIDVARRYDGWADWHEDDPIARQNASAGKATRHPRDAYTSVDMFSQANTVWVEGNTTFVLTPEPGPPPILRSWDLSGAQSVAVQLAYKRHIEKCYTNRPAHDPEVVVAPTPNAYWRFMLARVGVDYT